MSFMMSYTQKLEKISKFLKSTAFFWETEMITQNVELLPQYYLDWANKFNKLAIKDKLDLYNNGQSDEIKELCDFPKLMLKEEIKKLKLVKLKKHHELSYIIPQMRSKADFILDCCGGVGHLPMAYANNYDQAFSSLTIELNPKLVQKGSKLTQEHKNIHFELADIKSFDFKSYKKRKPLTIGLHSCGELSEYIIKSGSSQIMNWGCCYHKVSKSWLPISRIGKELLPAFTDNALTLAAKCYKPLSQEGLESRYRVKRFRYALDSLSSHKIQSTGSLLKKFYQGSFYEYIQQTYPEVIKTIDHTEIERFYKNYIPTAQKLISLGLLRDHWGRVIESAIILDRALYLEENGYEVEVKETFDRALSPRNLMIYAKRL